MPKIKGADEAREFLESKGFKFLPRGKPKWTMVDPKGFTFAISGAQIMLRAQLLGWQVTPND